MPPRSPASSVRRGGAPSSHSSGSSRARNAEGRQQHQHPAAAAPHAAAPSVGAAPSFRALTTPEYELADQGGGGGGRGDGGGSSFPSLFSASESPASEAESDTSESSSTSSSSGAILALGEREEADSRDELIGIFVPALDSSGGGPGAAHPSPSLLAGDRKVNENGEEVLRADRRSRSASSSSSSSGCNSMSAANSARRMGHHRALSSTCLEGMEPASHHHRRERSGSLLGERERELREGNVTSKTILLCNNVSALAFLCSLFKIPIFHLF